MNSFLSIKTWSLRVRIFISMIFITLISSILIASVAIYQFRIGSQKYHEERLERKEIQIKEHLAYVLSTTPHPLLTPNIPLIFKSKIFEISNIHNSEINIYDLQGRLLLTSNAPQIKGQISPLIPVNILKNVENSIPKRFVNITEDKGKKYRTSYSYLMDYVENKPLGIINLPYEEVDTFYQNEIENFLSVFGLVYLIMLIFSIFLALYLSRFITKSLKTISDRLTETSLTEKNERIDLVTNSYEIDKLIVSYNKMIDELEESANKLAQSEREGAWREMAKQVAHEIKNPLTPMRLTVQNFQRKFDVADPQIYNKVGDYSKTLIQQIDTMSAVASAFSNFASMPAQENETIDIVSVVELALDIFNEDFIEFKSNQDEIITKIDRTQLIRIITNLIKNAIQSIPETQEIKKIVTSVNKIDQRVEIKIKDNGIGIEANDFERIFEPKFTTKNSGMGLGLGIIKNIIENYNGTIHLESEINTGTTFIVTLPIIK
jgi:two-component system, NtrC family, nitrogen regulation sensor histidine kinase NtrY